jgi:hypothetical protein
LVERRQKIHEPDYWLVTKNQSQGTIHISHGSTLQVTWGEGMLPIFRGLDASGFYSHHFRHRIQLACHHLQTVEHLHKTGSGVEGERYPYLLHGLVSTGCHLRQEHFCWDEPELALFKAHGPCILQHPMGK